MFVSTPYFLINVITKPEVAEHLIPNIKNFDIVYYLKEEFRGGKAIEPDEKDIVKVQMLCSRNKLNEIMTYLKQHYIQRYGAVAYYEEVHVPL
jgi:hypothetical protein